MPRRPFINGFEGVGVVEQVGSAVDGFRHGDRVVYALVAGAYADLRLLPADRAILLPPDVSDVNAAASLLKGMTAEYLLHRAHAVTANDVVMVHAAAGGVGSFLCQWAKRKGATVIGTVGSPDKFANARMNGCDYVFSYAKEGWVEEVRGIAADLEPNRYLRRRWQDDVCWISFRGARAWPLFRLRFCFRNSRAIRHSVAE